MPVDPLRQRVVYIRALGGELETDLEPSGSRRVRLDLQIVTNSDQVCGAIMEAPRQPWYRRDPPGFKGNDPNRNIVKISSPLPFGEHQWQVAQKR